MANLVDIDSILKSNKKLYLSITGGGTAAISKLLENGGASNIFLGATVPYSTDDLSFLCGSAANKPVSEECADRLSILGYQSASAVKLQEKEGVCIGATSSLRKNGVERAGRIHQAYISVCRYDNFGREIVLRYHIVLKKERTRLQEEELLANLILYIAEQFMKDEPNKKGFTAYGRFHKKLGLDMDEIQNTTALLESNEE